MTPFLQFRVWLRRGPNGERVGAGVAAVAFVALFVWVLVPAGDDGETVGLDASAGGPIDGGARQATGDKSIEDAAAPGPVAADPGAVEGTAAGLPTSSGASGGELSEPADPCSVLTASDQGVTTSDIFIAVSLINLGGGVGNETFGIRNDLEAVAQATADGINSQGGIACRKLRIKTYRVNPLDQNEQRARCLEMAAAKPFAVIDFAGFIYPVGRSCFPEHKLPYQGNTSITEEEAAVSHPYMYSVLASSDRQLRNWVFESAERGLFDAKNGFRKLGLLLDECLPKVNAELQQNLDKVGVGRDKLSTFTLSCGLAPPNQIAQAVVKHRSEDNVSHVLLAVGVANAQPYVRQADGLGWRPVYTASDYGSVANSSPAKDWTDGFDGTVAITSTRGGELNSGIVHPQVARCQEWMTNAKVRPPTVEGDGALAMCDTFRLFAAAANAAGPNLARATLLDRGLAKVGRFETAGWGDGFYDRPGKVTGGDFIRAIQWHVDCRCWKVLDRDLRPGR